MRAVTPMARRFLAYEPLLVPSIVGALLAESPSREGLIPALLIACVVAGQWAADASLQAPRIRIGRLRQRRPVCNEERSNQNKNRHQQSSCEWPSFRSDQGVEHGVSSRVEPPDCTI